MCRCYGVAVQRNVLSVSILDSLISALTHTQNAEQHCQPAALATAFLGAAELLELLAAGFFETALAGGAGGL